MSDTITPYRINKLLKTYVNEPRTNLNRAYVGIPYTGIEKHSFHVSNLVTAGLMKMGYIVHAPISQYHMVALAGGLPGDANYWKHVNEEFIQWCDILFVVNPYPNSRVGDELIENSRGLQHEIATAKRYNKFISILLNQDLS